MKNFYDLIIVGAGITGLSTGIAFKKVYPQKSVIILEKNPVVGGCVGTFARQGYKFDTIQMITDVTDLMDYFGIDIELTRFVDDLGRLILVDTKNNIKRTFNFIADIDLFENSLKRQFPTDKLQIENFFKYSKKMYNELHYLKTEPKMLDYLKILINCPKIISNSNLVYHKYLEKFKFQSEDLYEILDYFSSFSGLSGNRCASLLTVCAMITTLYGSFRPTKGFVQFPTNLKEKFNELGGELFTKTEVVKIVIDNGKARGVKLKSGSIISSDYVISTADTKNTFGILVGYDEIEKADSKYSNKVKNAKMSPSGFAIHLGLDNTVDLKKFGLDKGFNILTTGRKSHIKMFDYWDKDELLTSEIEFHIAITSNSFKTNNKPNLIFHVVPVPSQYWIELRKNDYKEYQKQKLQIAKHYISIVEKYLVPGLFDHIKVLDVSTPATYARYINSPTGSNYDMMPLPNNFGKNRLRTRTPITNLFVPKFSHGIWPSMQAGLQVVDMISDGKIMNGNARYHKN